MHIKDEGEEGWLLVAQGGNFPCGPWIEELLFVSVVLKHQRPYKGMNHDPSDPFMVLSFFFCQMLD